MDILCIIYRIYQLFWGSIGYHAQQTRSQILIGFFMEHRFLNGEKIIDKMEV